MNTFDWVVTGLVVTGLALWGLWTWICSKGNPFQ